MKYDFWELELFCLSSFLPRKTIGEGKQKEKEFLPPIK